MKILANCNKFNCEEKFDLVPYSQSKFIFLIIYILSQEQFEVQYYLLSSVVITNPSTCMISVYCFDTLPRRDSVCGFDTVARHKSGWLNAQP